MTLSANQTQGLIDGLAPVGYESEMEGRSCLEFTAYFTDNDTANGVQTEETIVKLDSTRFPNGAQVVACYFAPGIAVTGSDTANKVITFSKRTSAGASQTTVAVLTTNVATGNISAGVPTAATLTAANCFLAAGAYLTYTVGVTGAGVKCNGAVTVTAKSQVTVVLKPL